MADVLKGTWVFNDTLTFNDTDFPSADFCYSNSAGEECTRFLVHPNQLFGGLYATDEYFVAYMNGAWQIESFKTINISSTLDDVIYSSGDADMLMSFLQANATKQVEPSGVTIEYNGSVIATVEGGNVATIPCRNKKMASDLVITIPEAEELVLQEKTATENGEVTADEGYDGLSKVTVNVPIPEGYIIPEGTLSITENGTHDVTNYANAEVNVPSGGGGITEVSTEAEMTALLESGEVGAIYKYVGETGIYENGALYTIEETPSAVTSSNGEVLTDSNGIVLVLKEE